MKRSKVLETTRHFMMADGRQEPQSTFGRARPASREYMLGILDHNHPDWRQIVDIEAEVETIIAEAYKKHNMV